MNNKRRAERGLVLIGILCWVVALVRVTVLSVAVSYLEYGLLLLGVALIIIAVALWKFSQSK